MITVKYGHNNQVTVTVASYPTVRSITSNASLRTTLGFGDNVEALVNGDTAPGAFALRDGDVVELITKANSKG